MWSRNTYPPRFTSCMAAAYLAHTPNLPSPVRHLGERFLDYSLEIQPGVADAHLLKAWYLHDRKQTEQAIESVRRAIVVDPDYAKAWLGLGFFLMESNEFSEAVSAFHNGLELYPGCPQRKAIIDLVSEIEQISLVSTAQNK